VVVVNTNTIGSPAPGVSPVSTMPEVVISNTPPQNDNSTEDRLRTFTDDGVKISVDQNGNLSGASIDALPVQLKREVQAAWREGKLATPDLANLEGAKIKTMGPGADDLRFRLLSPIRQVVRSPRPRFSWEGLSEAESYTVTISDADTYEIVDPGQQMRVNHWEPKRPLSRGHNYVWQVKAVVHGKQVIVPTQGQYEAKFRVLERSIEDELRNAESSSPQSKLALGVLYARAGLYRDAQRELQGFVRANPRSRTAMKLLAAVNQKLVGK
jgi:hypothetical protein